VTLPEIGPQVSPGFWLHHAALTWRAELDGRLRELGLTHTQFMVLASAGFLEHVGGPPTQQEVADHAGADRMMTSRVVRTLVEGGAVRRAAHETDARAVRLTLTPQGRELAARAVRVAQDVDRAFFGPDASSLGGALRGLAERRPLTPRAG
jgi:DNA-binding MarR family transcriptional regulator